MCFQSGSVRIAKLRLLFLWVWALYMACSSGDVRLSGWNSGNDSDVPVHAVLLSSSDENIEFSRSSE